MIFFQYSYCFIIIILLILIINSTVSVDISRSENIPFVGTLYVDAPNVQASYLGTDSNTETFNDFKTNDCPTSLKIGDITNSTNSDDTSYNCTVINSHTSDYGGATTSDSNPTNHTYSSPGNRSTFAAVDPCKPTCGYKAIDISLKGANNNYLGFWWSAGSVGNQISFFDNNNKLIMTVTSDDVMNFLKQGSILKSLDGNNYYKTDSYWGHPFDGGFTDHSEPFAYFHVYAGDNLSFSRIKIEQTSIISGFEFDNITVANTSQAPNGRLVKVKNLFPHNITVDPNNGQSNFTLGTAAYNDTVELPTNLVRQGYTFDTWIVNGSPLSGKELTINQENELRLAQDEAAAAFWAYPDAEWQINFQFSWLLSRFGIGCAEGPSGIFWGDSL